MFEGGRSKMGFGDQDPASRRRRSRSLPAEASIGFAPRLKLTQVRSCQASLRNAGAAESYRARSPGVQVFRHIPCPELDDVGVGIGDVEGTSPAVVFEGDDLGFVSRLPQPFDRVVEVCVVDL